MDHPMQKILAAQLDTVDTEMLELLSRLPENQLQRAAKIFVTNIESYGDSNVAAKAAILHGFAARAE